ncbi:hypothetical protein Fmac_021749 [Flemingia macrophylla]|uniref:TF-B3 domain-containing protein n=1 Tax=Flemingia macrophylla TaxID=520843 RepID=A0ABD1LY10_9FABA
MEASNDDIPRSFPARLFPNTCHIRLPHEFYCRWNGLIELGECKYILVAVVKDWLLNLFNKVVFIDNQGNRIMADITAKYKRNKHEYYVGKEWGQLITNNGYVSDDILMINMFERDVDKHVARLSFQMAIYLRWRSWNSVMLRGPNRHVRVTVRRTPKSVFFVDGWSEFCHTNEIFEFQELSLCFQHDDIDSAWVDKHKLSWRR